MHSDPSAQAGSLCYIEAPRLHLQRVGEQGQVKYRRGLEIRKLIDL
jgi:hypothetical protein